jgi:heme exporter protein B
MKPYLALIGRDLRLMAGRGPEALAALLFFGVTACLFPFAFGADAGLLARAAPGIVWVAALLAALLALDAIYMRDFDDGTLDLLLMTPLSPLGVALAKMLSHWIVSGLGLVAGSLVIAPMLGAPAHAVPVLAVSLLPGTLYLSLLGGMGAALTMGARRSGLLLAVLILPLVLPMLILGLLAAEAALAGLPYKPYLLLQLALVALALALAPAGAAAFLNMHLRSA